MILLFWACTAGTGDSGVDPCSTSTLSWNEPGNGLLLEYCDTCHSATSENRNGAPDTVTFDTEAEVAALQASMIRMIDAGSMPPGMPIAEQDKTLLLDWLGCME